MTATPRRRRAWAAALSSGLILVTAGCFAAEMKVTVNDDDTADIAYTLLVDVDQLGELAGVLGSEVPDLSGVTGDRLVQELFQGEDPCSDLRESLPGRDVTSSDVARGPRRGVACTATGVPLSELSNFGSDTTLSIVRSGADTTVEITLVDVQSLTEETEDLGAMAGDAFADLLEISFVVSAPGALGETNATTVEGNTATWLVTPDAPFVVDGDAQMRGAWTAKGSSDGGAGAGVVIILVVAALAVVALVLVLVRRRGRPAPGSPLPPPQVGGGA